MHLILRDARCGYLMREEWAQTADDVLWRRSNLGIGFAEEDREALARYMDRTVKEGTPV